MIRGSEFAELRAFAAVADRRSFARAAEALGVAPSTLRQTVRSLEERLGVTLLVRTTRSVSITSAGERLLERFSPALDEIEAAVLEARDGRASPTGTVRLHALHPAYASHVEPKLGMLRETLPDVMIDLTVDDGPIDVAAKGYDLVIRRAGSIDSGMAAVELGGDLRHAVVASPSYLAASGTPGSPYDLSDHSCIRWRPAGAEVQNWRFEEAGRPLIIAVNGPLIVSHCGAAIAAALQGVGIAYVLHSYSEPFTRSGALTPLLSASLPPFGGWKVCHPKTSILTAAARGVVEVLRR